MSIRDQFAPPKYSDGNFAKIFRQADGDNIYRLLPPMKRLAATRSWKAFLGQHFGYRVPSKKEKGKTILKTFMCVEKKNRQGMVTQDCPECNLIREQKQLRLDRFNQYTKESRNEADIKSLLEPLDAWLKDHNLDKKFYVAVKNTKDEFGAFSFPYKAYLNLEETLKDLREKHKIDAMDIDQGVWLNFRRTGAGPTTMHPVNVITETVEFQGRKLETPKLAPLSDHDLERATAECPDLELETVTILTYDQIKMLTDTAGDPDQVDAIFGMAQRNEASPPPVRRAESTPTSPRVEVGTLGRGVTVPIARENAVPITVPVKAETPAASKLPAPPPVDTSALSDDDFYKLYKQQ